LPWIPTIFIQRSTIGIGIETARSHGDIAKPAKSTPGSFDLAQALSCFSMLGGAMRVLLDP
jgi:hypothetical protein